jgi:hypothetical protein
MGRSFRMAGIILVMCLGLSSIAGCGGDNRGQNPPVVPPSPSPPPPPPPPDSEEAPIRVKNGSIDLELVTRDGEWQQSAGEWGQKDRSRGKDDLDITVAHVGGSCSKQTAETSRLYLVYNDGVEIQFKSQTQRIKVSSDPANKITKHSDRRLQYVAPGEPDRTKFFIKKILIGNTKETLCTFTKWEQLTHILILDFD